MVSYYQQDPASILSRRGARCEGGECEVQCEVHGDWSASWNEPRISTTDVYEVRALFCSSLFSYLLL